MAEAVLIDGELPVGSVGYRSLGWWGLLMLIATEGSLFTYLIFSYLYLAVQQGPNWGTSVPPLLSYGIPMTILLVTNSIAMLWAERSVKRNARPQLIASTIIGLLLVIAFIVLELFDWFSETFNPQSGAYGSSFFVLTGFHLAHTVAGALMLAFVLLWAFLGYFDSERNVPILVTAAYWHFTDAVWVILFIILFLVPHLS
ncbi:MAG: heme-copper oxidase subunit III [Deltaproteobacteria bacterium]|nr:heme-copper oxidase subunit III [Deltaproteobacteria bacterium]